MIKRVSAGFAALALVGLVLTSCGTVASGNVGMRTPQARDNLTPRDLDMTIHDRVSGGSIAKQRISIAEAEAQVELKRAEGIAQSHHIINQNLTREYLQHESNRALQKFAEEGGTTTGALPAYVQTAPLIHVGQ